jgi:hypothetical protein
MKRIAVPVEQAIDGIPIALLSAVQQLNGFVLIGPHRYKPLSLQNAAPPARARAAVAAKINAVRFPGNCETGLVG